MDYDYSWSSPAVAFCESILRPGYPEYFNLVTATIMLWGGLYGLIRINRLGAKLTSTQSASLTSLRLIYASIFANGIGSIAYHAKAWQGFRLMDDFSLVLGIYVALGFTFENLMSMFCGDIKLLREAAERELGIGGELDNNTTIILGTTALAPLGLELDTKKSAHTRSRSEPVSSGAGPSHFSLSIPSNTSASTGSSTKAQIRPLLFHRDSWLYTCISTIFYLFISAAAMVILAFDAFSQHTELFAAFFGSLIGLLTVMVYFITWIVNKHVLFPIHQDLIRANVLPVIPTASAPSITFIGRVLSYFPPIRSLVLYLPILPRSLPNISINQRLVRTTLFYNLDLCSRLVRRAQVGGILAACFWILTERVFCPRWPWQWQWVPGHAAWHIAMCWSFVQLAVVGCYFVLIGEFSTINDNTRSIRKFKIVTNDWWMRLGLGSIAQYVDIVELDQWEDEE